MDYKYILREIKLSKLTDIPMSEDVSKLNKFWDGMWTDMKVMVDAVKGEIKCWKDYYCYFYQNDKNSHLWCDHYEVWSFFKDDLGFECAEIQEFIQYMVGETLNCEVNTPLPWLKQKQPGGDTLKCEVNNK